MRKLALAALLLLAGCSAHAKLESNPAEMQALYFTGHTTEALGLKASDTLFLRIDGKHSVVSLNQAGEWLNEARPCPPFDCK